MSTNNQRRTASVTRCPSSMALSRAFRGPVDGSVRGQTEDYDPAVESVRQHASECDSCGREWRGLEALVAAARELPAPYPATQRSEAMRTALLLEASAAPPVVGRALWRRPAAVASVFATAAAAVVLLWIGVGGSDHSAVAGSSGAATEPAESSVVGGATVQAPDGAQFVHTAKPAASGTDEVVRLQRGRVTVAVHEVDSARRFRVVTGDAELEARAAAFDVEVSEDDRLLAVVVHSGNVRVRVNGQQTVLLGAGERYQPRLAVMGDIELSMGPIAPSAGADDSEDSGDDSIALAARSHDSASGDMPDGSEDNRGSVDTAQKRVAVDVPRSQVTVGATRRATGTRPAASRKAQTPRAEMAAAAKTMAPAGSMAAQEPAPAHAPPKRALTEGRDSVARAIRPTPRPVDVAFQQGWSLMRSGRPGAFARAATAFAKAIALAPTDPMAEDARYWHSVALARAGKTAAASAAMKQFLARHAASPRAPELSVMLGWIEFEAGDYGDARRHFRAGLDDRSPKVVKSARAGLASLPKK